MGHGARGPRVNEQMRPRSKTIASVFALTLTVVIGAAWWFLAGVHHELRCSGLLHALYQRVRVGDYVLQDPNVCTREGWLCPTCGAPYHYRPMPGPVHFDDRLPNTMIAWCASPCHFGRRHVLVQGGGVQTLDEAAFQRAVSLGNVIPPPAWSTQPAATQVKYQHLGPDGVLRIPKR